MESKTEKGPVRFKWNIIFFAIPLPRIYKGCKFIKCSIPKNKTALPGDESKHLVNEEVEPTEHHPVLKVLSIISIVSLAFALKSLLKAKAQTESEETS